MAAIETCRTAALGGHVEGCQECGHRRIAYNSCRNRHCPKCQAAAARDWLAAREADLLPVGYFHVVFSLPAEVADIAAQNKAVVYDLLFRAASQTMLTIAADPRHLGARIGITAVLHSWGSALTHHPHIHMIVPGGGISLDGQRWVSSRAGVPPAGARARQAVPPVVLNPADGVVRRGSAPVPWQPGRLARPHRRSCVTWRPTRKKPWIVYAKPPFAGPAAVLAYLSRYTHRVAISNRRLLSLDGARGDVPLQGLPPQRRRALPGYDASNRRVHPPLSAARPTARVPPHPSLRPARHRRPSRQPRPRPRTPRRTAANA